MNLSSSSLFDIPDLSILNVVSLDLSHNSLSELLPDHLPRGLERLNISDNYIGTHGLPERFPDTLKSLIISHCRIRSFRAIQQFPSMLTYFDASNMALETLDAFQCDTIEQLYLQKNVLKILTNLPRALQTLHAWSNSIRLLPTRLPVNLRILNLNNNCLTRQALPRHWGDSLEELYLDRNNLDTFPKNLPSTLHTLHLQRNDIKDVPNGLPFHLEVLLLNGNPLQSVGTSPRTKPIRIVSVSNSSLTEPLAHRKDVTRWASMILQEDTYDKPRHRESVKKIQKIWRVYRMRKPLKQWKRTAILKEELFQVSMMPERVWQVDVVSPDWTHPVIN